MKLYVKDIVREPKDTLYTFLYKVLNFDNKGFVRGVVNATYEDSEFKKLQCIRGRYRSFDEIVLISKTYFRVSDKAVAKILKKFSDNRNYVNFVLCDSAYKWVFHNGLNSDYVKYCANYKEGYKKTNETGKNGKYSFDDIITLMGLTKAVIKHHFKNYIKDKSNNDYDAGIYLMSCNITGNDHLDEEVVEILIEISDFNTEPELNPNSGNEIVLWGFYKSNLDN